MRARFPALLLLSGLAAATAGLAASGGPAAVNAIRLWAGPERTRVVLDISAPAEHTVFTLDSPERVVIDLRRGKLDRSRVELPQGNGLVRGVRTGKRSNGDLRVVLDLERQVRPRSFVLKPNATYGHRLVVDLVAPGVASPIKRSPAGSGRDVVIAIDPGHGGEDPGAAGRKGTREKDVVLRVARRLAAQIDREPGLRAVLIREGDYYISLRDRMQKARDHRADLFLSIHADAFRDKRARGASIYVLSQRGASDEAARWLAERENAADLIGGVSLDDKDDVLASVLLDLSQSAAISASMTVGEQLLRELDDIGKVHTRRVQQARFVVLKSPDIPSVLVETAFISNPQEERSLLNAAHQKRLAGAMMAGIRNYFRDNPPPGTRLAMASAHGATVARKHVIARGDTLSGIAHRYDVTLGQLRRANGLKSDRLRIGQVLQIPR